jgi:hypothetical protein
MIIGIKFIFGDMKTLFYMTSKSVFTTKSHLIVGVGYAQYFSAIKIQRLGLIFCLRFTKNLNSYLCLNYPRISLTCQF